MVYSLTRSGSDPCDYTVPGKFDIPRGFRSKSSHLFPSENSAAYGKPLEWWSCRCAEDDVVTWCPKRALFTNIRKNIIEGSLPKLQIYYKYIICDNTFLLSPKSPSSVQYSLHNKYLSHFSILDHDITCQRNWRVSHPNINPNIDPSYSRSHLFSLVIIFSAFYSYPDARRPGRGCPSVRLQGQLWRASRKNILRTRGPPCWCFQTWGTLL